LGNGSFNKSQIFSKFNISINGGDDPPTTLLLFFKIFKRYKHNWNHPIMVNISDAKNLDPNNLTFEEKLNIGRQGFWDRKY